MQVELEALRERDQQRLRQLQQTLADLEQQEKRLTSERLHRDLHTTDSTRITHTQVAYPLADKSNKRKALIHDDVNSLAVGLAVLGLSLLLLVHLLFVGACIKGELRAGRASRSSEGGEDLPQAHRLVSGERPQRPETQ